MKEWEQESDASVLASLSWSGEPFPMQASIRNGTVSELYLKFAELGLVPICDWRLKPVRILQLTSLSPVSLLHENPDV